MTTTMAACDYLEDGFLNHIFYNLVFPSPSDVYLGLTTSDPGEAGSMAGEPSGSGYSRRVVSGLWDVDSTNRRARLSSQVVFPEATGSWGSITHVVLLDAASGGNSYVRGALEGGAVAIGAGDQLGFDADALEIAITVAWSEYLSAAALNHILHNAAYAQPTPHVLLSTTTIGKDGSMSEPSGASGYARVATTPAVDWTATALGTGIVTNATAIEFPDATSSWGTVVDGGIADAPAIGSGNLLMFGVLNSSKSIPAGKRARFPVGDMTWGLT